MRLASYVNGQHTSFGVVREDGSVIDMRLRLGDACPDLKSALAQDLCARMQQLAINASADFLINDVILLPVIPNPARILCVGLNYLEHRIETKHKPDAEAPTIFMRLPQSQTGHGRPLLCPRESDQLDFEAELAVIIGYGGRRIAESHALRHVAGIAPYNDGSVRDWQLRAGQWTAGKNFPATGAFGPWMVTSDEIAPDSVLTLSCRVNGQQMQQATTDLMMFPIARLIAHISTFTALEPGDVIVTGTPGGIGMRRQPPVWLRAGDTVEVELEHVGILRNHVVKEA